MCRICDYSLGLNVPVTLDDGKLHAHLSCQVEREEREWEREERR
jgi:hypothetical protein